MATVVRMPAALAGVTEGAIQTWLVQPGQSVEVGAPLAEIETEKAVVEYAAEAEGTVLKLLVQEGVAVNVGDPIAVLGAEGESADDPEPDSTAAPEPQTAPPAPEPETAPQPGPPGTAPDVPAGPASVAIVVDGERRFASPIVRRLARERGIDLAGVAGTGPNGRIVRRDLDGVQPAPAPAPVATAAPSAPTSDDGGYDVPHTMMRKAIARRLTESKSTVPHFYVVADCRVDALLDLRKQVNEASPVKISVNDLVLKACAAAFVDVPEANATWGESAVRRHAHVDIGVAVAIEGGLVTPVIRAVETMTLSQIATAVADLAGRAREGKLRQHELEGGAFAVSNLGMYGITEFSAIINPPQAGILAVGAARPMPVVVDGALAVGSVMTVTMSADHRVVDGALAAQWLAAFQRHIERPLGMLV
jgi:pyruvate dehydrogenase E2 component (dihydrolipoamide acetyltransferase)